MLVGAGQTTWQRNMTATRVMLIFIVNNTEVDC